MKWSFKLTNSVVISVILFCLTFVTYIFSPVRQVTDSHYSMLLTQGLIDRGSFRLDPYFRKPLDPKRYPSLENREYPRQIRVHNGSLFYFFPPGSSALSVPFVFVLNQFGLSSVSGDRKYDLEAEKAIQTIIASFLTAAIVTILFIVSLQYLSGQLALLLACTAAFGTQLYSTASRALWSNTWASVLATILVFLISRYETKKVAVNPVLIGTIVIWMYFVRPTAIAAALPVAIYVWLCKRRGFLPFIATIACWLVPFMLFSWFYFQQILPEYYQASRLSVVTFPEALAGNLISPSRGLLIFSPIVLFLIVLVIKGRYTWEERNLIYLAMGVIVTHLVVISFFPYWWGGYSYGPRLTTELVPWIVLLAALSLHSAQRARIMQNGISISFATILLIASVAIHANGALRRETFEWNSKPVRIMYKQERLWDWTDPQFLR